MAALAAIAIHGLLKIIADVVDWKVTAIETPDSLDDLWRQYPLHQRHLPLLRERQRPRERTATAAASARRRWYLSLSHRA